MMDAMTDTDICQWIRQAAPQGRLASDSRRVKAGDVFFAYPGEAGDGRAFIGAAIAQGAAAVVYDERDFAWDAALERAAPGRGRPEEERRPDRARLPRHAGRGHVHRRRHRHQRQDLVRGLARPGPGAPGQPDRRHRHPRRRPVQGPRRTGIRRHRLHHAGRRAAGRESGRDARRRRHRAGDRSVVDRPRAGPRARACISTSRCSPT